MANSAVLALLAVTGATFISSLGYIFMKLAHLRAAQDSKIKFYLTW
jgi:hypothetical protein